MKLDETSNTVRKKNTHRFFILLTFVLNGFIFLFVFFSIYFDNKNLEFYSFIPL